MTTVPPSMMRFIQNLVPGFGGISPQSGPPQYSDGSGFDVWTSSSPQGMPPEFMNFRAMSGSPMPGMGNTSLSPLQAGGGYPGFQGFSPQANFPFPITQGPYQTAPIAQDGYNWGAPSPPMMPTPPSGGGYPGFQGYSPQANLPFPITQGPFQTSTMPQGMQNLSGGQQPQLMSHYYSDGQTTYWGEAKPDGYYQFTPQGNTVDVMRTVGYDDPNPYNYAYHPYFSGWASDAPYSGQTSQNPYYRG